MMLTVPAIAFPPNITEPPRRSIRLTIDEGSISNPYTYTSAEKIDGVYEYLRVGAVETIHSHIVNPQF